MAYHSTKDDLIDKTKKLFKSIDSVKEYDTLQIPEISSKRKPILTKEEHAKLGMSIYENQVRPQIEQPCNEGKVVAIDVMTGAFEVADNTLTASERLLAIYPESQIWCIRIGHRGVHRFALSVNKIDKS